MPELTLESLAARVAELERKLLPPRQNIIPATRDWTTVVGMFRGNESMKRMDEEIARMNELEHEAMLKEDEQ